MDENSLNSFIEEVLEQEKKEFLPGGLETFEMHANRLRQEITDSMMDMEKVYTDGFTVLNEALQEQGVNPPTVSEETLARFEDPLAFQEALEQGKAIYQMLEISPDIMEKYFQIALDWVRNSNFEKAKDAFYFLVTLATDTPAFWLGLGYCNAKLNHLEEARGAFRQVIDLDPKNGDAYLGCINALLKQKSSDEALKVCEEGLALAMEHENEPWAVSLHESLKQAKDYVKNHYKA